MKLNAKRDQMDREMYLVKTRLNGMRDEIE
jgi:hypothetical protein